MVRELLHKWRWTLALHVATICLAGSALLARRAMESLPPTEVTFFRMAIGLAVCLVAFGTRLSRIEVKRPLLLGSRGLIAGLAMWFYFMAIGRLSAGEATLLNNTQVVFALALAPILLKDRVTLRQTIAALGALAGVAILVQAAFSRGQEVGIALGLIAAVLWSFSAMAVRDLRRDHNAMTIFLSASLGGVLISVAVPSVSWVMPDADTTGILVAMGLFAAAFQLLVTQALRHATVVEAAVIQQLAVLWAALVEAMLGQRFGVVQIVGATILMISCTWLSILVQKKR